MMNEKLTNIQVNKENPFRVPEGYFEHFTEQMMQKLPAVPEKPELRLQPRRSRNYWRYAAAVVVAIGVTSAGLWQMKQTTKEEQQLAMTAEQTEAAYQEMYTDDYINEALDYAMVDNMEIASYLTEAD